MDITLLHRNQIENYPWYYILPIFILLWIMCIGTSLFIFVFILESLKEYFGKKYLKN